MSRLKNALPEDFEEGDYDLEYNPSDGTVAVFPQTSTDRLLDTIEVEQGYREYELSKYTSRELQDELTRRDK